MEEQEKEGSECGKTPHEHVDRKIGSGSRPNSHDELRRGLGFHRLDGFPNCGSSLLLKKASF